MLMAPPLGFEIVAGLLITRLWKFFACAPLIEPKLSPTPVNVMVDVPPAIVPAVVMKSLPMVVLVEPKFVVAPVLLSVRLKNVVVPVGVWVPLLPWKVTVPVPGVNVLLLVQLPPRAKLKLLVARVAAAMFRLPVITVLFC